MTPMEIKCEYTIEPIGIDIKKPRLSWNMYSSGRFQKQTAYQILVAGKRELLETDIGDLWESGKVVSGQSVNIVYDGIELKSFLRCYWKVRIWDAKGDVSSYTDISYWEMGVLNPYNLKASWIGLDPVYTPKAPGSPKDAGIRPPYLRKAFKIGKSVNRARVYVTALGVYEAFLNGKKIGEELFAPGWTDYNKRIQYRTYDVTDMLMEGENVLGVVISDGWYAGQISIYGRHHYGEYPLKLFLQMNIEYSDGSMEWVVTDESWKGHTGHILYSDILMGEAYDARIDIEGWNEKGFDDSKWYNVTVFDGIKLNLVAQVDPPVKVTKEIKPAERYEPVTGVYVFDLGQNITGRARFKTKGKAGDKVTLRFAEVINPDGTIYTKNLRTAMSTDTYILKGEGVEYYEPSFTFHGFRYIEVTGYPGIPDKDDIIAVVIHSDLYITGSFECSSPLVNRLFQNILWSQRGNFLSVPMDCPQRDERMGWMGDGQIFSYTACLNMNCDKFYTKWIYDMKDAQTEKGIFTDIAPNLKAMMDINILGDAAWGDAGIIVPWNLYLFYGDKRILETQYSSIKKWVDYLLETSNNYIRLNNNHWGDWLNIDAPMPKDVMSTAYFSYSIWIFSKIAQIIGNDKDYRKYTEINNKIRNAFIMEFVSDDGIVKGNTQTCYVLALKFGLIPEHLKEKAVRNLIESIKSRNWHLSTGFVGVGSLLPILADNGYVDIAYRLLSNETFPSWGYQIKHGATTVWEHWDSYSEKHGYESPRTYIAENFYMNSFNHYAAGSVGEFIYRYIGGINFDINEPAFKHVIIKPLVVGWLTFASTRYDSVYGRITSKWELSDGIFSLYVTIPANTTATVYIPGDDDSAVTERGVPLSLVEGVLSLRIDYGFHIVDIGSGEYEFKCKFTSIYN